MTGSLRGKFIGDKAFYRMVLAIAVPIMIQNGITNFVLTARRSGTLHYRKGGSVWAKKL